MYTDEVITTLSKSHFHRLGAYFHRRGIHQDYDDLANKCLAKLARHVKQRPDITLEHATNLLWRIAVQGLSEYLWTVTSGIRTVPLVDASAPSYDDDPADDELRQIVSSELKSCNGGKQSLALLLRFQNVSWKEIGKALGVSGPTACLRVTRAFALVVVRMADRGFGNTLLNKVNTTCGKEAMRALRMWALGMTPRQIMRELEETAPNVRKLLKKAIAMISQGLRRKPC
jgi:DNA-directed RNA polymerase specialized sigma24 family protein